MKNIHALLCLLASGCAAPPAAPDASAPIAPTAQAAASDAGAPRRSGASVIVENGQPGTVYTMTDAGYAIWISPQALLIPNATGAVIDDAGSLLVASASAGQVLTGQSSGGPPMFETCSGDIVCTSNGGRQILSIGALALDASAGVLNNNFGTMTSNIVAIDTISMHPTASYPNEYLGSNTLPWKNIYLQNLTANGPLYGGGTGGPIGAASTTSTVGAPLTSYGASLPPAYASQVTFGQDGIVTVPSNSISLASACTVTLSSAQLQNAYLIFTDTISSSCGGAGEIINFPSVMGASWVVDLTAVNFNSEFVYFVANGVKWPIFQAGEDTFSSGRPTIFGATYSIFRVVYGGIGAEALFCEQIWGIHTT